MTNLITKDVEEECVLLMMEMSEIGLSSRTFHTELGGSNDQYSKQSMT